MRRRPGTVAAGKEITAAAAAFSAALTTVMARAFRCFWPNVTKRLLSRSHTHPKTAGGVPCMPLPLCTQVALAGCQFQTCRRASSFESALVCGILISGERYSFSTPPACRAAAASAQVRRRSAGRSAAAAGALGGSPRLDGVCVVARHRHQPMPIGREAHCADLRRARPVRGLAWRADQPHEAKRDQLLAAYCLRCLREVGWVPSYLRRERVQALRARVRGHQLMSPQATRGRGAGAGSRVSFPACSSAAAWAVRVRGAQREAAAAQNWAAQTRRAGLMPRGHLRPAQSSSAACSRASPTGTHRGGSSCLSRRS